MKNQLPKDHLCPLEVASKLLDAKNSPWTRLAEALTRDPQLREIIWFIQWRSIQPGGLKQLSRLLIEENPFEIGPAALVNRKSAGLTWPLWKEAYRQMPYEWRKLDAAIEDDRAAAIRKSMSEQEACLRKLGQDCNGDAASEQEVALDAWDAFDEPVSVADQARRARGRLRALRSSLTAALGRMAADLRDNPSIPDSEIPSDARRQLMAALPEGKILERARAAADEHLASVLRRFCVEPGFHPVAQGEMPIDGDAEDAKRATWFMPRVIEVLRAMVKSHAQRELEGIAKTAVRERVFEGLDFGWEQSAFVEIQGSTRFGKSESARTWAKAHPGRARYFAVPSDGKSAELNRVIADALGLRWEFSNTGAWLGDRVNFILQHAGLMILADEAHFLLPARFGRSTLPHRLNWFRTQLVDRRVPCAIITTPQSYGHQINQYTKATGYVMDQWLGRPSFRVRLPEEIGDEDINAVRDRYLPGISMALAKEVTGRACLAPSFLKAFEDIAKMAEFLAQRVGVDVSEELVSAAMEKVIPRESPVPVPKSTGLRQPCNRVAEPVNRISQPPSDRLSDRAIVAV